MPGARIVPRRPAILPGAGCLKKIRLAAALTRPAAPNRGRGDVVLLPPAVFPACFMRFAATRRIVRTHYA
jgi:hypothetical protein